MIVDASEWIDLKCKAQRADLLADYVVKATHAIVEAHDVDEARRTLLQASQLIAGTEPRSNQGWVLS